MNNNNNNNSKKLAFSLMGNIIAINGIYSIVICDIFSIFLSSLSLINTQTLVCLDHWVIAINQTSYFEY